MLDLTEHQRALELAVLLDELLGETGSELVLLDKLELLFDPGLRL